MPNNEYVQVNLSQKLLFLHQLTHNMTTDCSLNYKFNTWKFQAQNLGRTMLCTENDFDIQNNLCTQHVLPMFCKNRSFWQRFNCTYVSFLAGLIWAEMKCSLHVTQSNEAINKFKLDQQIRQQMQRTYCPHLYTVRGKLKLDELSLQERSRRSSKQIVIT